jgi:hypothetical protein
MAKTHSFAVTGPTTDQAAILILGFAEA